MATISVLQMAEALPDGQDFFMWVHPDGTHHKVKLENFVLTKTVADYAEAQTEFSGTLPKLITIESDGEFNDFDKSIYFYNPLVGVAQLMVDFKYSS